MAVTANTIREYVLARSPWVDLAQTVDTVKCGNGDRPVETAGVCWFPSLSDIRAAHRDGCTLLITHEPLFYDHFDRAAFRTKDAAKAKSAFLEQTGMTVLRLHDSWDQWPDIGIRDSWAAHLGFHHRVYESESSEGHRYHGIYQVEPQPLRQLAETIARRAAPLGEDVVQVIGDPNREVCRPALGVGCIGPQPYLIERGADVVIHCFDGAPYWMVREAQAELGAAVITVEHGTSEIPGIENLRDYLAREFPSVAFHWYAEHPRTWTARGEPIPESG